AGDEVGCDHIADLTILTPLPTDHDRDLQIVITPTSTGGGYSARVHSRPGEDSDWVLHAEATLTGDAGQPGRPYHGPWPPEGAVPVPIERFYSAAADAGYDYGPTFQNLRNTWQHNGTLYADITLTDTHHDDNGGHAIHPALLDAALHPLLLDYTATGGTPRVPFTWTGVTIHSTGATHARVTLTQPTPDTATITLHHTDGTPLATIDHLQLRPLPTHTTHTTTLLNLHWQPVVAESADVPERAVVGEDRLGIGGARYPDVDALVAAVDSGIQPPAVLVLTPDLNDHRTALTDVLTTVQQFTSAPELGTARLVVLVTDASVAAGAVLGLLRVVQSEHPGRVVVAEVPETGVAIESILGTGYDHVRVHEDGSLSVPQLRRADPHRLTIPVSGEWRLDADGSGSLDGIVVETVTADVVGAGEVRVAPVAAGVNFRDVLVGLGVYPGGGSVGVEGAGVVVEVGVGVGHVAVGDRVLGLWSGGFGSSTVVDGRLVVRVPDGWSMEQAAGVPVVWLTAWLGLVELAGLRAGQRVLVHAAAGGVGMAAVQLARWLGAEVWATASESKWDLVDVPRERLASSRSTAFVDVFPGGFDVVLNSLAGEFVDASVGLLRPGGVLLEMGKTDVRGAEDFPGVRYVPFDMIEAGPERLGGMLRRLMELFGDGTLTPVPVTAVPVQRVREVLRDLGAGRTVGKQVLTMPARLDPDGTVLITGGTGGLGVVVAEHLVRRHGVRKLVLASRSGVTDRLAGLDAEVRVVACDVTDRAALADLVGGIDRLTGVVHAAGVIDDGTIEALTPQRLEAVLAPKLQAALWLDELTRDRELALFVLFSSVAGVIGNPGQGNYAAANAGLDALATIRHRAGLPATSIAWGLWEHTTGMTAHLKHRDRARLDRATVRAMPTTDALALLDAAIGGHHPAVIAANLNLTGDTRESVPAILRGLATETAGTRRSHRRAEHTATGGAPATPGEEMARLDPADRHRMLLGLVRSNVATVLGFATGDSVDVDRPLKELGFDSLTAVELRNRLGLVVGTTLPASVVFDHPTVTALAAHLTDRLGGTSTAVDPVPPASTTTAPVDAPLAIVGMACRFPGGVDSPEDLWRVVVEGRDVVG
ncbi:SDR family NAD(P)-dependent oxidoreductase, partial [Micromonospora sp. NPDC047730]|uniref:SDR family NAD(P)-dependent oxidoreductase n=1 Tax=Micromonospora sp. NPDC047730 TaxID=3364253 RepID=UPI00371F04FC